MVKIPPANARDEALRFDPGIGKTPWSRKWPPVPVFLPGKFHGQRTLAGSSPWGCKESDTTELPSTWSRKFLHFGFLVPQ